MLLTVLSCPTPAGRGRVRAAGWFGLAGRGGGAVWRHLTPTEERAPLYMQMKPKDLSVPLDTIVHNSEKSRRIVLVVAMRVPRYATHTVIAAD